MAFGLLAFTLGACAELQLFTHATKEIARNANPTDIMGTYKVGNPYQIEGVWYTPAEDPDYIETGIASWYGEAFHGKRRDLQHERADRGPPYPAHAHQGAGDQPR